MKRYDDPDYDEIDGRLDQELFEAIFGTSELPEGMTHAQAIGQVMATSLPEEELENLIEVPSKDSFDEWICLGEERRKEREAKKK